jgi:hypothetical protein
VALSGPATISPGEWVKVSVSARGGELTGTVGPWGFVMARPPERKEPAGPLAESAGVRSGFAFYLRGKDAGLRVKDVKLEIAPK